MPTHILRGNGHLLLGEHQVQAAYLIEWAGPRSVTGHLMDIAPHHLDAIGEANGMVSLRLENGRVFEIVTGALIPEFPVPILAVRSAPTAKAA